MQFSDSILYHLENDHMQEYSHGYTSSTGRIPRLLLFHLYTSYSDNKQNDLPNNQMLLPASQNQFVPHPSVSPGHLRFHTYHLSIFF